MRNPQRVQRGKSSTSVGILFSETRKGYTTKEVPRLRGYAHLRCHQRVQCRKSSTSVGILISDTRKGYTTKRFPACIDLFEISAKGTLPKVFNQHRYSYFRQPKRIHYKEIPRLRACREYSVVMYVGNRDSWLVKRRTRDRKVASSNPGRCGGKIFFTGVSFVC